MNTKKPSAGIIVKHVFQNEDIEKKYIAFNKRMERVIDRYIKKIPIS